MQRSLDYFITVTFSREREHYWGLKLMKDVVEHNFQYTFEDKTFSVTHEIIHLNSNIDPHYFSKYLFEFDNLDFLKTKSLEKIDMILRRDTEYVYNYFKTVQKTAIISKYALFTLSYVNDIPLYKLPLKAIIYKQDNDKEKTLSVNSVVKMVYRLSPRFEKIINNKV